MGRWAKLDVTTYAGPKRKYNDSIQAYAAGFVEGHLTRYKYNFFMSSIFFTFLSSNPHDKKKKFNVFNQTKSKWLMLRFSFECDCQG